MLKIIGLTLILLINVKSSFSQFETTDIGAVPVSLGGAFTSLADNSNAVYYNPSGINQLKYREISVFYSPAPFGLKELSHGALNYIEPAKLGSFGFSAKLYGYELYREITATLTYANNYKSRIYYGFNLNYYNLSIKNYGSASSFGADVGMLAFLTDNLRWGFSAFNLTRTSIGQTKEKLPAVYRTGLTYSLRNDLNIIADFEKDTRYPLSVKGGIEYNLMNNITLRAGAGSEPVKFSAGIGLRYSIFQIDYAFYNHQDLGLTHMGSVTISFGGTAGNKKIQATDKQFTEADTSVKKPKIKKLKANETVNINYAGKDELMRIPNVSGKIADGIIEYRTKVGLIENVDELLNVKGIKEKKLQKIRPFIRLKD